MPELDAKLLELANDAQAFAAEQLPLYAQELLAWMFWSNVLCAIAGVVAFCTSLAIAGVCFRIVSKQSLPEPHWVFGCVLGACGVAVGLCVFFSCTYEAAKVRIAPRVAIVDHLTGRGK